MGEPRVEPYEPQIVPDPVEVRDPIWEIAHVGRRVHAGHAHPDEAHPPLGVHADPAQPGRIDDAGLRIDRARRGPAIPDMVREDRPLRQSRAPSADWFTTLAKRRPPQENKARPPSEANTPAFSPPAHCCSPVPGARDAPVDVTRTSGAWGKQPSEEDIRRSSEIAAESPVAVRVLRGKQDSQQEIRDAAGIDGPGSRGAPNGQP